MTQERLIKLLEQKPRLCTREIVNELQVHTVTVCRWIRDLIDKKIIADNPTEFEKLRIKLRFPNSVLCSAKYPNSKNRLKVFMIKNAAF